MKYIAPLFGYSVNVPAAWTAECRGGSFRFKAPEEEGHAEVIIVPNTIPAMVDPSEFTATIITVLSEDESIQPFNLELREKVRLRAREAQRLVYSYHQEGKELRADEYHMVEGNVIYLIDFITDEEGLESFRWEFDRILRSFRPPME